MKRNINYIIVKVATVNAPDDTQLQGTTLAEALEDDHSAKNLLHSPWIDYSGFHLLITPQGKVLTDIIPQRPGEASPGYNAESLLIGCIAVRGADGLYQQTVTTTQRMVAAAVTRTLMHLFSKATFKMGSAFVMNCKPDDFCQPPPRKCPTWHDLHTFTAQGLWPPVP